MSTRIGDLIRATRLRHAMTQHALATRAGMSRSYLAQVELGRRKPTEQVTRALARTLGLSLYDAFEAAGLLSSAEIEAAQVVADNAIDQGATEAEIARARDGVLIHGGTLTTSGGGGEQVTFLRPRKLQLVGWERLSVAHQELIQGLVDALLEGDADPQ